MNGDSGRIRSLLLQGFTPVLAPPHAGIGWVHLDDRDVTSGRHGDEPGSELGRGNASDSAPQPLPTAATTQRVTTGGPGVSEIEVLHRDRGAIVVGGEVEQRGNRGPDPAIAPGGR